MSKSKFLSAVKSDGFGFCSVVFGWDRAYGFVILHNSPC
jgi:hypothetical protein